MGPLAGSGSFFYFMGERDSRLVTTVSKGPLSTYVINNRIPRFPIRQEYADRDMLRKRLEDAFQVWLKERFISNLIRRKICSQIYDFNVWLDDGRKVIEDSNGMDFRDWCARAGQEPLSEWADFLRYARLRVPELSWSALAG